MFEYTRYDYLVALVVSVSRYSVFIIQYYLMFKLYGIEISVVDLFMGISLVFLIKSILPISILGDFGVRELAAVSIFGAMGYSKPIILVITISIWLLNIVIPSLIGSFLSKRIKL